MIVLELAQRISRRGCGRALIGCRAAFARTDRGADRNAAAF